MSESEQQASTPPARGVSRRTLARGAKWAVPTVVVATAVPVLAASDASALSYCTTSTGDSWQAMVYPDPDAKTTPNADGTYTLPDVTKVQNSLSGHLTYVGRNGNAQEEPNGSEKYGIFAPAHTGEVQDGSQTDPLIARFYFYIYTPFDLDPGSKLYVTAGEQRVVTNVREGSEVVSADLMGTVVKAGILPGSSLKGDLGSSTAPSPSSVTHENQSATYVWDQAIPAGSSAVMYIDFDFSKISAGDNWKYGVYNASTSNPYAQRLLWMQFDDTYFTYHVTGASSASSVNAIRSTLGEMSSILTPDAAAQLTGGPNKCF